MTGMECPGSARGPGILIQTTVDCLHGRVYDEDTTKSKGERVAYGLHVKDAHPITKKRNRMSAKIHDKTETALAADPYAHTEFLFLSFKDARTARSADKSLEALKQLPADQTPPLIRRWLELKEACDTTPPKHG